MASDDKWKGKNLSYMTPAMMHALKMSQMQSQNKYKAKYNDEVRGKGFAAGESLDTQRARKMSSEQSLLKYHMDFETSKGKGFTAVSDTPEMLRIKKQQTYRDTEYKKEFLEQKGHNIPVVETPETVRVKQQQKFLSDIKYQEDRNKLKGKATQVTDDPSTIRAMEAAKIASNISYKKSKEKTEEMERRRQQMNAEQQNKIKLQATLKTSCVAPARHPAFASKGIVRSEPIKRWRRNPGSIFDYDPSDYETDQEYETGKVTYKQLPVTSLTDTEDYLRVTSWKPEQRDTKVTSWTDFITGKAYKRVNAPGSIMDYDPVAQMSASTKQMNIQERPKEESNIQSPTASEPEVISHPIQAQEEPKKEDIEVPSEQEGDGLQYRAMYDYTAQDEDEVSFMDGDIIINAQRIDDGWMFGTVKRTGQIGMLPSNYVEVQ